MQDVKKYLQTRKIKPLKEQKDKPELEIIPQQTGHHRS